MNIYGKSFIDRLAKFSLKNKMNKKLVENKTTIKRYSTTTNIKQEKNARNTKVKKGARSSLASIKSLFSKKNKRNQNIKKSKSSTNSNFSKSTNATEKEKSVKDILSLKQSIFDREINKIENEKMVDEVRSLESIKNSINVDGKVEKVDKKIFYFRKIKPDGSKSAKMNFDETTSYISKKQEVSQLDNNVNLKNTNSFDFKGEVNKIELIKKPRINLKKFTVSEKSEKVDDTKFKDDTSFHKTNDSINSANNAKIEESKAYNEDESKLSKKKLSKNITLEFERPTENSENIKTIKNDKNLADLEAKSGTKENFGKFHKTNLNGRWHLSSWKKVTKNEDSTETFSIHDLNSSDHQRAFKPFKTTSEEIKIKHENLSGKSELDLLFKEVNDIIKERSPEFNQKYIIQPIPIYPTLKTDNNVKKVHTEIHNGQMNDENLDFKKIISYCDSEEKFPMQAGNFLAENPLDIYKYCFGL
jgi:hypothetical protein